MFCKLSRGINIPYCMNRMFVFEVGDGDVRIERLWRSSVLEKALLPRQADPDSRDRRHMSSQNWQVLALVAQIFLCDRVADSSGRVDSMNAIRLIRRKLGHTLFYWHIVK